MYSAKIYQSLDDSKSIIDYIKEILENVSNPTLDSIMHFLNTVPEFKYKTNLLEIIHKFSNQHDDILLVDLFNKFSQAIATEQPQELAVVRGIIGIDLTGSGSSPVLALTQDRMEDAEYGNEILYFESITGTQGANHLFRHQPIPETGEDPSVVFADISRYKMSNANKLLYLGYQMSMEKHIERLEMR